MLTDLETVAQEALYGYHNKSTYIFYVAFFRDDYTVFFMTEKGLASSEEVRDLVRTPQSFNDFKVAQRAANSIMEDSEQSFVGFSILQKKIDVEITTEMAHVGGF